MEKKQNIMVKWIQNKILIKILMMIMNKLLIKNYQILMITIYIMNINKNNIKTKNKN